MLQPQNNKGPGFIGRIKNWIEDRRISSKVRRGKVPIGYTVERISEALKATKTKGALEAWGFTSARVFNPDGTLKFDYGLQSVKEITAEFVKYLVDGLLDSAIVMDDFDKHAMGSGSTAETDTQTALIAQEPARVTGTQTHGATSNIYKSIATITANTAFGVREHGIFDSLTATSDILLDRSLVTAITLVTGDEVEWTYNLTINQGG